MKRFSVIFLLCTALLFSRDLNGELVIFPSPATGSINVCYELDTSGPVNLLIYDLNGQLVCRRDFIAGQPGGSSGYNQVALDLDTYSRRPLSNGVYIAALLRKTGNRSVLAREKFIVLR